MSLVEETFSASLKTVETRSSEGKTEKSNDRWTNITIISMSNPSIILTARKKSRRNVGSGIISISTTEITPIPMSISVFCIHALCPGASDNILVRAII
jgi:hypothetical protein